MNRSRSRSVALVVAHPDDETLWAGGTILHYSSWQWFIISLCRGSDKDRAPKFYQALKALHAEGIMGDLDDGPDQNPLEEKAVECMIADLLPPKHFDLIISHHPRGEYTRHIRHEEVGKSVIKLWRAGEIDASELWTFAYEDGNKKYYPLAVENASQHRVLTPKTWQKKFRIITQIYGFEQNSWEAQTTPKAEAFWKWPLSDDPEK